MTITAGIDVGTGAVKAVLFDIEGNDIAPMAKCMERLRRRDPL
ncbi:MAG: benzoyl-CoA reductase subunit D, partial [Proteobacteria bacterium]|nr:benzoyl-CoA reductase subunit D [Pseudomonadota bacterium]